MDKVLLLLQMAINIYCLINDNKRNGQGTNTFENGKVEEGIFKDNQFINSQNIKELNIEKQFILNT